MKSIFVLTGAGISAESGIKTFRDSNGLWENHRIEDVASPEGFQRNPKLVQEFYNLRRRQLFSGEVKPNPAHAALAKLEQEYPGEFLLVTQNVDNLHERAGSRKLLHMHGELAKIRCQNTSLVYSMEQDIMAELICQCCQRAGTLRPHIVWFGEIPFFMDEIYAALANCELFISVGTSSVVYPAAMFVEAAKAKPGVIAIEVNPNSTEKSLLFDAHLRGAAGELLPNLVEAILAGKYN